MSVAEGRHGRISVSYGSQSTSVQQTVAEMGEWTVGGMSRNMIDYTAFGDATAKFKPGMLDPGTVNFSGHFDGTDNEQKKLVTALSSGGAIDNTARVGRLSKLRMWANDDTSFESFGFWSCTGSSGMLYVTSLETAQNKDGLATLTVTLKVSKGALQWSTAKPANKHA